MLVVNHVTKNYGKFTAIEDISLEFKQGIYGLLAPNGAGKTTLIKMLTTLIFPTKGEILWNGSNIYELDETYREIIGYLPQDFGYYGHYSPRQFLKYLAALKGINPKSVDKRIEQVLEMVSLSDVADKKLKKFSGGMLRRVGIAQAMLNEPKILILDEPTSGLDPRERVKFRNIINQLGKERIVILSTHIVSDIETIADQIIMFKDHKLYCCESPEQVCNKISSKIFEIPMGTSIQEEHCILSERQEGGNTIIRFTCESKPENAKEIIPNLEDAFLCIFQEEEDLYH